MPLTNGSQPMKPTEGLAVACAILLGGSALGARMFAVLRHAR